MFFRPASIRVPESLRVPSLAPAQDASRARHVLPLSGFRLDILAGADEVLRLEVRNCDGTQLVELSESIEPLGILAEAWRGGTARTGRWAVAVGVVVSDLSYVTFLNGRRARASNRLSMSPTRIRSFWYAECAINARRVDVVVAGRSTGVQPLRSWTQARR